MLQYPHRIRLLGPWELVWETPAGDSHTRVRLPVRLGEIGLPAGATAGILRRRFGYPGRLDAWERVWLMIPDVTGPCDVLLNDATIARVADEGDVESEIRDRLKPRNCLELRFEPPTAAGGIQGEPHLLIRASAWLGQLTAVFDEGRVRVRGCLIGTNVHLLDVYVMARETIGYTALAPGNGERWFEIVSDRELDVVPSSVVVELVQGGVRWDRCTVPVSTRN